MGATEAPAPDLLPILTTQLVGQRLTGSELRAASQTPRDPGPVRNTRQLSVGGSAPGTYTDHAARVWRRSFLHADEAGRQAMATAAQQARDAHR